MTPNTPLSLSKISQEGLLTFHRQCYSLLNQQWNIREQFRNVDLAYMREKDWTDEHKSAQLANKYGDSSRFQNVTVPVVKPLIEAAVTYQTSVFLTGNPIFGVVADPAYEDEALQMATVIGDQSIRGGWVSELMQHFRNGFKYNLAAIEIDWKREVTAAIETDLSFSSKLGRPKEVIWEGNALKNMDMYNTFFDSRVKPTEVHKKGEFVGYTEVLSRIALKGFINTLPDKILQNVVPAFESGMNGTLGGLSTGGIESYYIPQLNPAALIQKNPRASTDWMAWAGMSGPKNGGIQYKNMYEVTTLYARILPSDFSIRVPSANTPQIWKFIFVNHQVLIYAERQTNAHGFLPILFSQPYEDGLAYQTKSLANDMDGLQDVSSAYMNSIIASRRRAISDRVIYDPSRISEAHINSANPAAKIPVRPSAYGKPVADSVYQFPYRETEATNAMQGLQQLQQFAYLLSGQNQARQGQFVKGNKTQHEFADVMSHANGNDQKVAMLYETQLFTPLKEILKINILQYQGGTSLYNPESQKSVNIDPVALRKAVLNFKISDGLTPADKLMNSDAWTTSMQIIGSSPQIGSAYNIAPMFSYLMKTQGADLKPFEKSPEQVAYEQAMQQWQQVVMEAVKSGQDVSKMSQPKPADYNYDPAKQGSAAAAAPAPTEVATRINNIQNNISNVEG